ncbi:hypothetical protein GCM10010441_19380 [Kitasatospora paracochleata]|uniref:Peptidoglycan/xylan/chitin deacetylase (PgdA/CDA1 family) n=1 Tax=Kitasatospora paracochleata TaxID=58354 RepID=A0ABT1J3C4_9ACTN|nr:polysaccharide deacetylase family protein [Kitasatospora paracochleata]MCP2311927.1 peptidoglycan/xylan/chitin deacetylase (PgdA/CDA1 family) [Kitasatospora paracochleata]
MRRLSTDAAELPAAGSHAVGSHALGSHALGAGRAVVGCHAVGSRADGARPDGARPAGSRAGGSHAIGSRAGKSRAGRSRAPGSERSEQAPAGRAVLARRPLLILAGLALLTTCEPPRPAKRTPQAAPEPEGAASALAEPSAVPGAKNGCPPQAALAREPEYYLRQGPRTIALTIDDGPDPRYTPAILDILARHGVTATFCMVGQNAAASPELVRRVAAAGHQLANHTWSHPDDLAKLTADQIQHEIELANRALHDATGVFPTFFRAPGGAFTRTALATCARLGLEPLAWSVDPDDWKRPGTDKIVDTVLRTTRTGSIILNHDGGGDRAQTVAALATYLPRLLDSGYRFANPAPSAPPAKAVPPAPSC